MLYKEQYMVRGNTRFILSVEHDISRVSDVNDREISCLTREINLVLPITHMHVFFCLLDKQRLVIV